MKTKEGGPSVFSTSRATLFQGMSVLTPLCVAERVDIVVHRADDAEQDDAEQADSQGHTRVAVALERGYGAVARFDVHGLYDEQVVVERDDRIDQGDEHEQVLACIEGCHEPEELREKPCERRYTGQGEET